VEGCWGHFEIAIEINLIVGTESQDAGSGQFASFGRHIRCFRLEEKKSRHEKTYREHITIMATLLARQSISSDIAAVKNTYSSWDTCMTKAYCKWPAIIGIIIGSLILLSLLWCVFRCLCFGAECCCGCLSCCNACCPSRRKRRNDGYYQQPPPQSGYQPYPQYQSPQPPIYVSGGAGYRGAPTAQTATFDAPSKNGQYNEDALPPMPSWDHGVSRRVEEEVEMEKFGSPQAQQESLLPNSDGNRYYSQQDNTAGDLGNMHASPYHDYDQHQQFFPSPTSTAYPPTYHTSPTSTVYEPTQQLLGGQAGYAPSLPPSYRTRPSSVVNPPPQNPHVGRKPVQGTWRDV